MLFFSKILMSKRPREGGSEGECRPSKRGRGGFRGGRGGRGGKFFKPASKEEIERLKAQSQLVFPSEEFGELSEENVGITVFTTETKPFRGIIKQRYSDFMVHEIDLEGNVVRLTDTSLPKEHRPQTHEEGLAELKALVGAATANQFNLWLAKELEKEELRKRSKQQQQQQQGQGQGQEGKQVKGKAKKQPAAEQEQKETKPTAAPNLAAAVANSAQALAEMLSIPLEDEEAKAEAAAAEDASASSAPASSAASLEVAPPSEFLFDPSLDKSVRTKLHQLIRRYWPMLATDLHDVSLQDTKTTAKHEMHCVRARLKSAIKRGKLDKGDARALDEWPPERPPYLRFALYKENKDTMEAIAQLARVLQLPQKLFSYAGTKDKRAITCQWVTAYKIPAEKVSRAINLELSRGFRNIRTGHYSYVEQPLKLGELQGNRFTIVLRDVDADEKTCLEAVEALARRGFVNYYGMQRFGTGGVPTHLVGKALLRQDWARAVALILAPRSHEKGDSKDGRDYFWETRDAAGALNKLPRWMAVERSVLTGLAESGPNAFLNALQKLPKNMRLMYMHAFQSYVWNHMASERVRLFGLDKPVVGDLVFSPSAASGSAPATDTDWLEDAGAQRVLSSAAAAEQHDTADSKELKEESETPLEAMVDSLKREFAARVHVVTQQDLDANKYSITDVVLPLPGFAVVYPQNALADKYREFLEKEGFSLDSFVNSKFKELCLPGSYRKLVQVPGDVKCSYLRYDDPTLPLTLSDAERLEGKSEPMSLEKGASAALRIEFSLPASTYATMLLREVTKEDTTKHRQRELNKADNAWLRSSAAASSSAATGQAPMESSEDEPQPQPDE